jgi:hypothetical protein
MWKERPVMNEDEVNDNEAQDAVIDKFVMEVPSLDDQVIESLLFDIGDTVNGSVCIQVEIMPDALGYSLVMAHAISGRLIARSAAPTFKEALAKIHDRFSEDVAEQFELAHMSDDDDDDDE